MSLYPNNEKKKGLMQRCMGVFDTMYDLFALRPKLFGGVWGGVFVVLLIGSWAFGLMPELDMGDEDVSLVAVSEAVADETSTLDATADAVANDSPTRIIIDSIDVDSTILNPQSTDLAVLDDALLDGVVHYPGSGNLEDTSNMFLFGHSSGLRVIQNDAFKVFNNLKELEEGNTIRLQSDGKEYVYRVNTVSLVNADEAFVELSNREKTLTLSTCNSFGSKQERYVVNASFVGSYVK